MKTKAINWKRARERGAQKRAARQTYQGTNLKRGRGGGGKLDVALSRSCWNASFGLNAVSERADEQKQQQAFTSQQRSFRQQSSALANLSWDKDKEKDKGARARVKQT